MVALESIGCEEIVLVFNFLVVLNMMGVESFGCDIIVVVFNCVVVLNMRSFERFGHDNAFVSQVSVFRNMIGLERTLFDMML